VLHDAINRPTEKHSNIAPNDLADCYELENIWKQAIVASITLVSPYKARVGADF